jgi:hypothetical protein
MSIQVSGTDPLDQTFVSDGTRAQLVSQFQTVLDAAGWSVVSGGGSSDVIMESATTPQGLKIRMEAIDPGTGNCAQFKIRDSGIVVGTQTLFMKPVNSAAFRIWADKYQFFYFLSGGDTSAQRCFICGGTPWIPDFLMDNMAFPYGGWIHGNGATDTDTRGILNSLRNKFLISQLVDYSAIWNGAAFGSGSTTGVFGLVVQTGITNFDDLWEDGTFTMFEPIICWQSGSFTQPVRHGQLWDAVLTSKPLDSEVKRVIAGKTWRNVTHQNGTTGGTGRGSLMLLTAN